MQNIPVAVCDLEGAALSRELIRAVADADQYNYRETLTDEFIAIDKLERGELLHLWCNDDGITDWHCRCLRSVTTR
ncbi:MAG: hypothetical protein IJ563_12900 [Selenomonadaceae bacterium]|nr:hypothetical protein [Selenomonadaceae bacterium]